MKAFVQNKTTEETFQSLWDGASELGVASAVPVPGVPVPVVPVLAVPVSVVSVPVVPIPAVPVLVVPVPVVPVWRCPYRLCPYQQCPYRRCLCRWCPYRLSPYRGIPSCRLARSGGSKEPHPDPAPPVTSRHQHSGRNLLRGNRGHWVVGNKVPAFSISRTKPLLL